jgi:hypothetical protein
MDPPTITAKLVTQKVHGVLGTGDDCSRKAIDDLLHPPHRAIEETIRPQEVMIYHLAGKTPLEVEDQRDAQEEADRIADQSTFMEMGVYDVRPLAQGHR